MAPHTVLGSIARTMHNIREYCQNTIRSPIQKYSEKANIKVLPLLHLSEHEIAQDHPDLPLTDEPFFDGEQ